MADKEAEKKQAASRAVDEVRDGMLVGLGTGSTAEYVVREIAARIARGLRITATSTSRATEALARSLAIPLVAFEAVARVDLTIDGADEVDSGLRAIKGGGGAMLREKIVAAASDRMVVAVDSSKLVPILGRFPLPVEVLPFAASFAARRLEELGPGPRRRTTSDGSPFLTDQKAYIFDLPLGAIPDPEGLARTLERLPGLIGHGLFLDEIDTVVVGEGEGVRVLRRG
ncbi:MAG: ribose 5-phosphate isomerase [Sphingomonadales bacterium]|jgi:ribose 5-phosphate isomerase A|nr:ribose 5-phosphate isomerase [Sphingomonadales bacterium]